MPETVTWDKIAFLTLQFERDLDPLGDTKVFIEYGVIAADGKHPQPRGSVKAPLNATRQNQANLIMADALAFVKSIEGIEP